MTQNSNTNYSKALIAEIARIRAFEERLLSLFSQGLLSGTTHTCIGQEAATVALHHCLEKEHDAVFSNHRCHGHFLAYGGSMRALFAEIMGKEGGVCGGKGGSQHLCWKRFFSNGILGGMAPIAAGYALKNKRDGAHGIVVLHLGDGALGEGVIYETLNIAALKALPILFFVENNGFAQSTDTSLTTSGSLTARFEAFGIKATRLDAHNPVDLIQPFGEAINAVRAGAPHALIINTFRLAAHSKGDDNRPPAVIEAGWQRDYFAHLIRDGDPIAVDALQEANAEIDLIIKELIASPDQELDSASAYAPSPSAALFSSAHLLANATESESRCNELIARALDAELVRQGDTLVLGEDILDPYGGAFKATKGLSTRYGEQVFSTPISEAALTGIATGYCLNGGHAIAEIMFSDFSTLVLDQIANHAAKFHYMYNAQVSIPLVLRIASGGYRGYGPTHSQCGERLLKGNPGVKIFALSKRHSPATLLRAACTDPNPIVFVENKQLYTQKPLSTPAPGFIARHTQPHNGLPPLFYSTTPEDSAANITVVTYGGMTTLVEQAMEHLILDDEIDFDYFILSQLYPLDPSAIVSSVQRTQRLLFIEEGPCEGGFGSELVSSVTQALPGLPLRCAQVGALPIPIPNSRAQELSALPSIEGIVERMKEIL